MTRGKDDWGIDLSNYDEKGNYIKGLDTFKGIREEDFKGKPRDIYANEPKKGPADDWLSHKWNELFPDEGTKR